MADDNYSSLRGLRHYDARNLPVVLSGIILMAGLCAWLQWQDIWIFYSWRLIFSGLGEWTGNVLDVVISRKNALNVSVSTPLLSVTPVESMLRIFTGAGFAPIFPDTCYHLTHYWLAAVDIPVASDNPVHYADAIRYNARTPLQGSLLPLTRLVWA